MISMRLMLRGFNYQLYESNPEKQREIKNKMLLCHLFAIRTKYNVGFRQYILKHLFSEFNEKLTFSKFEKWVFDLIPELQGKSETYLDIFSDKQQSLEQETIKSYQKFWREFYSQVQPKKLLNSNSKSNLQRLQDFEEIFEDIDNDSAFGRAYQDMKEEFRTGNITCRYANQKDLKIFISNYINPLVQESFQGFTTQKMSYLTFPEFENLIGQQLDLINQLTNWLEIILKDNLIYFPEDFPKKFSLCLVGI